MPAIRLVISDPKTGRSVQKELKEGSQKKVMGLYVGQTLKGEIVDLQGYEFMITGGSDNAGFPMRKDLRGTARKKILAVSGIGLGKPDHGRKQRRTVAGSTVHAGTAQINLKITKAGAENIFPEPKAEEKKN